MGKVHEIIVLKNFFQTLPTFWTGLKGVEKLNTLHFHVPHIKLRGYISLTQFGHQIPTGPPFSDI